MTQRSQIETRDETEALRARAIQWIENGWSPGDRVQDVDLPQRLGKFYADDTYQTVLHDDNYPNRDVVTSASQHFKVFAGLFKDMRLTYLENRVDRFYLVTVDDRLGFTSLVATANFRASSGDSASKMMLYSLLWESTADGWKIISEHATEVRPNE